MLRLVLLVVCALSCASLASAQDGWPNGGRNPHAVDPSAPKSPETEAAYCKNRNSTTEKANTNGWVMGCDQGDEQAGASLCGRDVCVIRNLHCNFSWATDIPSSRVSGVSAYCYRPSGGRCGDSSDCANDSKLSEADQAHIVFAKRTGGVGVSKTCDDRARVSAGHAVKDDGPGGGAHLPTRTQKATQ